MTLNLEHVYIAIWTQMLNSILGWSEHEVLIWAEKYSEYLKDPDDIFFHEDPPYWAATALIPDHLGKVLSADQRSRLRNKILMLRMSFLGLKDRGYENTKCPSGTEEAFAQKILRLRSRHFALLKPRISNPGIMSA